MAVRRLPVLRTLWGLPLEQISPASSQLTLLQKKAKDDSHAINALKKELDKLKQVQQAQQVEIDAVKAKQDAFEKAGPGEVGDDAEGSQWQGQGGRKRARSVTDTLEQQEGRVISDQSTGAES